MNKMLLAVVCLGMVGSASMFAGPKSSSEEIILKVVDGSYDQAIKDLKATSAEAKAMKDQGKKLVMLVTAAKPVQELLQPVRFVAEKIQKLLAKLAPKLGNFIVNSVDSISIYVDGLAEYSDLAALITMAPAA
jgi:hypothetical protein